MKITINPKPITKENFSKFGDMITTDDIKPLEINDGYAKRFDGIANLNTSKDNGETTICIFSALKRSFPMKIDMMEKHPLGSQAFVPMKETTFLVFVAPKGVKPNLSEAEAFIVPSGKIFILIKLILLFFINLFLNTWVLFADKLTLFIKNFHLFEFLTIAKEDLLFGIYAACTEQWLG